LNADIAIRARVEELKAQAESQQTAEAKAWAVAREKFAEFVAATAAWAKLTQAGLDTRAVVRHEFASRPELEALLAVLRPFGFPQARDLADVVYLLSEEVDTSGARLVVDNGLPFVERSPARPFGSSQSWETQFS
jgi:hypothetical protein